MDINRNYSVNLLQKTEKYQQKEGSIKIEILFPFEKHYILQKLIKDLIITNEKISDNVNQMDETKFFSAQCLINSLDEKFDSGVYRRLKQLLLGGVRFEEKAKCVSYNVSDPPVLTKMRMSKAEIVDTKTRTNFTFLRNPIFFPKSTLDNLLRQKKSLNESNLCDVLMNEIEYYFAYPAQIGQYLNELILESFRYSENEKYKYLNEINKYLLILLDECKIRYKDLTYGNQKELISFREECLLSIQKNMMQSTELNYAMFSNIEHIPYICEKKIFSHFEMVFREEFIKTVDLVKRNLLLPDQAKGRIFRNILNRLELDIAMDRLELQDPLQKNLFKGALVRFFIKNTQTVELIDTLMKKNSTIENLVAKIYPVTIETFSMALEHEIFRYLKNLPSSIKSLNGNIFEYNRKLSEKKISPNLIFDEAQEIIFRMDFILKEIEIQENLLSQKSLFLSFRWDEILKCNQFYQSKNTKILKEVLSKNVRSTPLMSFEELPVLTDKETILIKKMLPISIETLTKYWVKPKQPSLSFRGLFLQKIKEEKIFSDPLKIKLIKTVLDLCFRHQKDPFEQCLNILCISKN